MLGVAACVSHVLGGSYQDAGPGTCTQGGMKSPSSTVEGYSKAQCQAMCTTMANCYGFSHTFGNACITYTEGPLSGGGPQQDGSHCIIKSPAPSAPTGPVPSPSPVTVGGPGTYQDCGPGMCTASGGGVAKASFLPGTSAEECGTRCTAMAGSCAGYSASDGACLLFTEGPLSGGGPAWGFAHCLKKAQEAMALRGASSRQELAETVSLGATAMLGATSSGVSAAEVTKTSYNNAGPGVCASNGHSPQANFYSSVGGEGCAGQCTAMAKCYGYSATKDGDCKIFTEGPLEGGGEQWSGAECLIKSPEPAHQLGSYQDAGPGVCVEQSAGAVGCTSTLLPGMTASQCEGQCTEDATCAGYSSQDDDCLIFKHCPLQGGGRAWGFAHCHIKSGSGSILFP